MRFSNVKVGMRLAFAFSLILFITVVIAGIGVWRLQELADTPRQLTTTDNERLRAAVKWHNTIDQNLLRARAALLDADTSHLAATKAEIMRANEQAEIARSTVAKLANSEESTRQLSDLDGTRDAYRKMRDTLFDRRQAGEDVSEAIDRDLRPLSGAYTAAIIRIEEHQSALYEKTRHEADLKASQGRLILITGAIIALLLGLVLSYILTRSITAPLQLAAKRAGQIAEGDLTQAISVQGRDEAATLLQALQHMQDNLARVVSGVRSNAESVAIASAEISQGNNNLSARTEQQASALEETAASMEELGSTVRQNADNARQANQLAMNASAVAVQGGNVVAEVVDTMKGINDSSRKIADIIGVIDGIAFQTNILALNAAVEAARAGEQGRGFAVVAGEVRNLAQRSAEAAKEIKALINASVNRVEQGTVLVDKAGTTMTEVVNAIRRVTDIMGEISAASSEQSAGVSQVGEAITQMDQATQQNAALVEQSAAAADSLKTQAGQLVQAVAVFRLGNEDSTHHAYAVPNAPSQASQRHHTPLRSPPAPKPLGARAPASTAPAISGQRRASESDEQWESF